ncbi:SDR family NAD(P)-dependent oxidoreductase [Vineibacter terrae]|uniref:SDR family NAD(P)-dependent oxidoreductase n=1 Tax=Vineibacter terrae TaxID=2586908 RepID=UPI002E368CB0|nr:SDR family NAD(P)-dependent oxidoreductase [Vineibacter terrae]HEX2885438.1 SDR family NAD(P)-dependent oxidoreductase [Vineibacter terrae]
MTDPSPPAARGRLAGRIALVTGASRGIGEAVARRFAAEGAHVIAVARTIGGLEALDDAIQAAGGTATLVPLDLVEFDAIDRMGLALFERFGKLDILVGNAGLLGVLSPVGHIEPKVFERVLAVNVTANWRLLRSLDPLLRRSDAGRAIFVTSGITRRTAPYWGAYAPTKAALETLVRIYAAEVAHTAVKANLINPGPTRTRMRADAYPGENPATLPTPDTIAAAFVPLAEPSCSLHGAWVAADEWLAGQGAVLQ